VGTPTPGAGNGATSGDTDKDGLPDAWELANFGSLTAGPDDDPDGDGMSNRAEFLAGTSPVNAASALRLSLQPAAAGGMQLQFTRAAGRIYVLRGAAELAGPWEKLAEWPSETTGGDVQVRVEPSAKASFTN
jgi:hypothetical protein